MSFIDTIRDGLVCKLWSKATQKRLLNESNLTLARAIEVSMAAKDAQQWNSSGKVATENQRQGNQGICFCYGKAGHQDKLMQGHG